MRVDRERSEVYAAEIAAFAGTDLEDVVGVDVVDAAIRAVVVTSWWPAGEVSVRAMRSDAHSSATRCAVDEGSVADVGIARPQATIATAAHELAHVLAGVTHGHDPIFRRAHLDVVDAMTNPDRVRGRGPMHREQLSDAYAHAGLAVGERRWPAPGSGGAIAL